MLHASAHPHEAEPFAAFIAKYIAAAHARLLAKGFTAANSVCTQCDSRQPESAPCSEVLNGGMCKPRWPDWAWIVRWRCFLDDLICRAFRLADWAASLLQLEEFLDSGLANTSGSEQLVRDHLQAVQAWGFDFEWMCEIPEQHS